MRTAVRRLFKAAVVGTLGAVVAVWFRNRGADDDGAQQAEWPPLRPVADTDPVVDEPSDGAAVPAASGQWIDPHPDGGCPVSHPVKVKLRSGIYHVPGGLVYDRTNADRCYVDPDAAEGDGYRASRA